VLGRNVEVKVSLPSDREIEFSCRLHRQPRLVFEAWAKPEHLKQWWGCEGVEHYSLRDRSPYRRCIESHHADGGGIRASFSR
jgi:uncharacterized protein YndB with AHSA1/START domain